MTVTSPRVQSPIPMVAVTTQAGDVRRSLVLRLTSAFASAGLSVAVVTWNADVTFDRPHSDSDRLRHAGAVAVGLVARDEAGIYGSRTDATDASWMTAVLDSLPSSPDLFVCDGWQTAGARTRLLAIVGDAVDRSPGLVVPVLAPEPLDDVVAFVTRHLSVR